MTNAQYEIEIELERVQIAACNAVLAKLATYKPTTRIKRVWSFLPLAECLALEYPDYDCLSVDEMRGVMERRIALHGRTIERALLEQSIDADPPQPMRVVRVVCNNAVTMQAPTPPKGVALAYAVERFTPSFEGTRAWHVAKADVDLVEAKRCYNMFAGMAHRWPVRITSTLSDGRKLVL